MAQRDLLIEARSTGRLPITWSDILDLRRDDAEAIERYAAMLREIRRTLDLADQREAESTARQLMGERIERGNKAGVESAAEEAGISPTRARALRRGLLNPRYDPTSDPKAKASSLRALAKKFPGLGIGR